MAKVSFSDVAHFPSFFNGIGQKRAAPETGPDQETAIAPALSQNDGRACESLPPCRTGVNGTAKPRGSRSTATPQ